MTDNLNTTDTIVLDIKSLSHEGRGIGYTQGKTAFVTGALPGETVRVKPYLKKRKIIEGTAIEVLHAVPDRLTPACPHFTSCGGCALQHWPSVSQIQHKQQALLESLLHIIKLPPDEIAPPLTGPTSGYRHKARLGVKFVKKKNKIVIGFRERAGQYITDCASCLILHPHFGENLQPLKDLISGLSQPDKIPQIEIAVGDDAKALILRHLAPLTAEDEAMCLHYAKATCTDFYTQASNIKSIRKLWPKDSPDRLYYTIPQNCRLGFHPSDFTQINPFINRQMIQQALDWLQLAPSDSVLDLFCGIGNFSLPLARVAKMVVGVEGCDEMVARAKENAANNGLTNTDFYQADLSADWAHHPFAAQHYDAIILDPPRLGAANIVRHIKRLGPQKICYISCHPATLIRDAAILVDAGFRLRKIGVMDMFPHTTHIEAMALFEKT